MLIVDLHRPEARLDLNHGDERVAKRLCALPFRNVLLLVPQAQVLVLVRQPFELRLLLY